MITLGRAAERSTSASCGNALGWAFTCGCAEYPAPATGRTNQAPIDLRHPLEYPKRCNGSTRRATETMGFAVHNRSTGWENCCEPQQRHRTFYTRLSPICRYSSRFRPLIGHVAPAGARLSLNSCAPRDVQFSLEEKLPVAGPFGGRIRASGSPLSSCLVLRLKLQPVPTVLGPPHHRPASEGVG